MDYNLWFILKTYYDSSKGIIKNHCLSDIFNINCGVKQGGILSAYLFNIFIDEYFQHENWKRMHLKKRLNFGEQAMEERKN